ncbi:sensor histidine kinase [Nonomuraea sp. LPB2021202275-12-8]|uniref:sensor histidine kinase n=1 Tax=Nonomuraea sp. LPB2021202275-12-8 TaxID=3120159 RepID=UPI00300C114D
MFTRWSVRRRLTVSALLATLGSGLVGVVLATPLLHALLTNYVIEQTSQAARRVSFDVERRAPDDLKPVTITENVDLIQVVDDRGKVRQASSRLLGLPPLTRARVEGESLRVVTKTCTDLVPGERCLITVGYWVPVRGTSWMVYAYSSDVSWYISPTYVLGALLGVLAASLITANVASLVAWRALAPVAAIKNELAEITATDLERRVPRSAHQDELDDLARTINQTLERLERAVEQQRRFAADASHDLRSPITAMRAQLEEALLYPRDTEWPRTGQAVLDSLDRLQAIVTDLLTLAKLDASAPQAAEPVDLAELVEEELARRPRSKRMLRELEPGLVVTGDRMRLSRLLMNLLDNAERHAEFTITVTARADGEMGVLEILDDGAGIAPDQREQVFRRFARLDASRSRDAGGTGLGLPIAREIAHAHNGSLTIEDSDTGARFVLRIPLRND